MATKEVAYGAVKLPLTKKEYAILEYMMLHKNQVVDAKQIVEHAWDSNADFFPDTLKYHIHAIKKKIVEVGGPEYLLKNVRGIGYMVVDES